MTRSIRQRLTALILPCLLASCGGGGGSAAVAPAGGAANAAATQNTGTLAFSISVPSAGSTTAATSRAPQYVSSSTKSLAIKVAGLTTNIDLANGSSGCASDIAHATISETGTGNEPRGMTIGADNNPYFVEDAGGGVAKFASGVYSRYATGRLQNSLSVGPDGAFWIANVFSSSIGHLSADWTTYTQFNGMPADQFKIVTAGADNSVWFNTFTGSPQNAVYHVSPTGTYLGSIPTQLQVTDVTAGPDAALWAVESDASHSLVARFANVSGTWTLTNELPIPVRASKLLFSKTGLLWLVSDDGHVQTMTTAGVVTAMPTLAGGANLQISFAPDGALWVPETNVGIIARISATGAITTYPIPTANADAWALIAAPDGSIYFTERSPNKLGHIQFPVTCSASATVPAGSATATLTAYDATGGAGGSGKPLSTVTVPVNVPQNSTTTLNFVLNGIVNNVTIAADSTFNPGCSASGTYPLTVTATDPGGNIIVGPGTYSDASGNALTFALTTSDASGHSTVANGTVTAPGATPAPSLKWTSGFLNTQTVSATVSGGAIPGSIIPAALHNGGCN